MSSALKNLSAGKDVPVKITNEYAIGIVVSEYYSEITYKLRDACMETLKQHGIEEENIIVEYAPGAFELPLAAQWVYDNKDVDAVICLGCVIKGETSHDVYINTAVANQLMHLSIETDSPFIFGVLTPDNHQQAEDRAGGKHGNKGTECAMAALKMLSMLERLEEE
ncbi:MAG: 6,7-dimethyl-8-ribityllumazine synthase [Chitinophagales bacterium]